MKTKIIYEPAGKAKEYSPLAANLYSGCSHGCKYCYVPKFCKKNQEEFHQEVKPRKDILRLIEIDSLIMKNQQIQPVLLCFTCDPYQPEEEKLMVTRRVLKIFKRYGVPFQVLTKGGMLAERDFDLYTEKDLFATSLTLLDEKDSLEWEPGARLPQERIETIKIANKAGIKTWVSLEPVIDPYQTLEIIRLTHSFVDKFKVGKLNHHAHQKNIDWKKFALQAIELLEKLGKDYYIKIDLAEYLKTA